MSEFHIISTSAPPPPVVPTSFVTDDATIAIPALNILNVLGGTGITTYSNPNLGNNLYIQVQNSFTDQVTTVGATTENIRTVPLTDIGTYTIEVRVAAWESTTPAGAGFSINGVVRTDGVTAVLIGDSDGFAHKDSPTLDDANVLITVAGNTALIQVVGVFGLTINWGAFTVYVFRGI